MCHFAFPLKVSEIPVATHPHQHLVLPDIYIYYRFLLFEVDSLYKVIAITALVNTVSLLPGLGTCDTVVLIIVLSTAQYINLFLCVWYYVLREFNS